MSEINFKPKKYTFSEEELLGALQAGYITEEQYKLVKDLLNEVIMSNKDPEEFAKEHGFSSFNEVVKELEFIRKQINRFRRGEPPMSTRRERETKIVTKTSLPFDLDDVKKAMQEAEEYLAKKVVEEQQKAKIEEVKESSSREEKREESKVEERSESKIEKKIEEKKAEDKSSNEKKDAAQEGDKNEEKSSRSENTLSEGTKISSNDVSSIGNSDNLGFGEGIDIDKLAKEVLNEATPTVTPSSSVFHMPTIVTTSTRVSTDVEHVRKIFQLPRPEAERYPIILEELETHANFHRVVFGIGRRIFFLIPLIDGNLANDVARLMDVNPDELVDKVIERIKELIEVKKIAPRLDEVVRKIKVIRFVSKDLLEKVCDLCSEVIMKSMYIIQDLRYKLSIALAIMSDEQKKVFETIVSNMKSRESVVYAE